MGRLYSSDKMPRAASSIPAARASSHHLSAEPRPLKPARVYLCCRIPPSCATDVGVCVGVSVIAVESWVECIRG